MKESHIYNAQYNNIMKELRSQRGNRVPNEWSTCLQAMHQEVSQHFIFCYQFASETEPYPTVNTRPPHSE